MSFTGSFARGASGAPVRSPVAVGIVCVCLGWASGGIAGESIGGERLIIGGYPDSLPYLGLVDGEADGLCVRLAREAFERAGIGVDFKILPFKRLLHEGRAGRMGIVGFYFNQERAKRFDYTDAFSCMKLRAYGSSEVLRGFRSLEDLAGLSVAVARGPSYGPEIDAALASDGVEVILVNGFDSVLRVLVAGRADLAFDTSARGTLLLRGLKGAGAFDESDWVISANDMHVAFPKSMGAQASIAAFNRSLTEMRDDGTYRAILSEFFLQEEWDDIVPVSWAAETEPAEPSRE